MTNKCKKERRVKWLTAVVLIVTGLVMTLFSVNNLSVVASPLLGALSIILLGIVIFKARPSEECVEI